ncbi:hypothetical protein H5410_064143 [Solanum commersonii]|uniref:Uncharacterized protein n=1 Tax=Solanum commersonii TaxID=4109 RepID=A0A9J5W0E3_SOLCO|nr:hypothetical protein H5410_064143 [Solanum commersonii]
MDSYQYRVLDEDLLIDDAFRRQQAVTNKAPFLNRIFGNVKEIFEVWIRGVEDTLVECFRGAGQKEKRLLAKGSLSRPGGEKS